MALTKAFADRWFLICWHPKGGGWAGRDCRASVVAAPAKCAEAQITLYFSNVLNARMGWWVGVMKNREMTA
eukprot:scaffold387193_cov50-Prasinocladus_malaysianus.AAC.1